MKERAKELMHCGALGCIVLAAYTFFLPPPVPEKFGTNNSVRFYLAKSLALDGSFTIEKYYRGGIDAAYSHGHFYSGKAPATSFLAVPVYRLVLVASAGWRELPDWVYLYLLRMAVISLPSVLVVLLMHAFLRRLGTPDLPADLIVLGYGLGTMAFPYSTEFVGHQLAAVFLFCCFLMILRWRRGGAGLINQAPTECPSDTPALPHALTLSRLFLAGLMGGMAVCADYQTALILLIIFCFTVFPSRRIGSILTFALGCMPGIVLILWYNYACFGNALSFPYAHEAMPIAREVQSQGIFGVQVPRLVPFIKLLFSPWRGLFFVSPFLLLAIPGFYSLARSTAEGDDLEQKVGLGRRRLFWVCLLICLGYILFNSSYKAWSGGSGYGPRFLVPVIPFLVVPIGALMATRQRAYGWLLALLVIYSVAFHLVATSGGPLAHEYLRNPVGEFLLPSVVRGNIRANICSFLGWRTGASLLPFIGVTGGLAVVFFATGKGYAARESSPLDPVDRVLRGACMAGALAMVVLLAVHRTEETAYRYAILGVSYDWVGDTEMAIPLFEQSLRMDPGDRRVLDHLTGILIARGEFRKALEINIRALAARRPGPGLQARCTLLMRAADLAAQIKARPGDRELPAKLSEIVRALGYQASARGAGT